MLRCLLTSWTIGLLAAAACAADGGGVITDDRENRDWQVTGSEATLSNNTQRRGPTLVIAPESFAAGSMTFTLETDATEVQIKSGSRRIDIALSPSATHRLTLVAGESPSVQLDGQTVEKAQRIWPRIYRKPTLNLIFPDAKRVRASWQSGGAATTAPGGDSIFSTTEPGGTAVATAAAGEELALQRTKQALLRLQIDTETKGLALSSKGVVVAKNGLVITRAHPLRDATALWAIMPLGDRVELRVLSIDTTQDLAILRLDPTSDRWQKYTEPLDIAPDVPAPEGELWAVGLDAAGRFTLGKAGVEDTRLSERLPVALQEQLGAAPTTRWVAIDLPVSIDASGGVLVDGLGRLVGLNVWLWPDQMRGGLAQSTIPVAAMVESVDANANRPLAQVRETLAKAKLPFTSFPLLMTSGKFDPVLMQRAVNLANEQSPCPQCKGETEVTIKKRVGYQSQGMMRVPVYEEEKVLCRRCGGSGLNHAKVVADLMGDVAKALAFAKRDDEDFKRLYDWTGQALTEVGRRNTVELMNALNSQTLQRLQYDKIAVGQPIVVLGWMDEMEMKGEQADQPIVTLTGGRNEQSMIVRDVDLTEGRRTTTAVVGGLLAGFVTNTKNERVPVIQKGYIVGVPSEGIEEPSSRRDDARRRSSSYRTSGRSSSSGSGSDSRNSLPGERSIRGTW